MESTKRTSRNLDGDDQLRPKVTNSGQDQELLEVLSDWVGKLKIAQDNPGEFAQEMHSLESITSVKSKHSTKEANSGLSRKEKKVSQKGLQSSTGILPSIADRKSIQQQSHPMPLVSNSVSHSQQTLTSVYGQNLVDASKTTKLSTLLMRIGQLLHDNPSIMASFGITTRGRIDDLLGPMELQTKINGLLNIKLSHQEVVLLMNRFGTAGVSGDKIDVVEVLSWARSSYERTHQEKHYQREVEKTRKEVQRLMRRNHVQTKTERKRIMNAELEKKVELKLSLASLSLINGNDKSSDILEKTEDIISIDAFKALLPKMELFLSNLELNYLVSHYVLGSSEHEKNYINFDMFRGTIIDLAKDTVKAARQEKAVSEFKSALSKGALPLLSDQSSAGSASEILEMIHSFQEYADDHNQFSSQEKSTSHSHQQHQQHLHHQQNSQQHESANELEILSDDTLSVNTSSIHSFDNRHVRFNHASSNARSGNREAGDDILDINALPITQKQQLPSLSPPKGSHQGIGSIGKPSPKMKPSVDSVLDWIADPLDSKQGPGTSLSPLHSNKIRAPSLSVAPVATLSVQSGAGLFSDNSVLSLQRNPARLARLGVGMADGTA